MSRPIVVKVLVLSRMNDRVEATFSHVWASMKSIESVVVVRGRKGRPHPKVNYIAFPGPIDRVPAIRSIMQFLVAVPICISWSPDIICGVNMSPIGYYSYILSKVFRKPLVIHLVNESQGALCLRAIAGKWSAPFERAFALKTANHAAALTTTGDRSRLRLLKEGFQSNRVYAAPSIVDTSGFYPMRIPKIYDLITVSRLSKEKRIDLFLHVVKELAIRYPIRAAVAGTGPEGGFLKDLAVRLNISSCVDFLGWVDERRLNRVYNSAKVFVLTSSTEGFPTTIAEALCAGVCVVSSDVGDVGTIIEHGVTGFLVSRSDRAEEYARYVQLLLEDDNLSREISQAGIMISSRLSYASRIEVFNRILRNIVSGVPSRSQGQDGS